PTIASPYGRPIATRLRSSVSPASQRAPLSTADLQSHGPSMSPTLHLVSATLYGPRLKDAVVRFAKSMEHKCSGPPTVFLSFPGNPTDGCISIPYPQPEANPCC